MSSNTNPDHNGTLDFNLGAVLLKLFTPATIAILRFFGVFPLLISLLYHGVASIRCSRCISIIYHNTFNCLPIFRTIYLLVPEIDIPRLLFYTQNPQLMPQNCYYWQWKFFHWAVHVSHNVLKAQQWCGETVLTQFSFMFCPTGDRRCDNLVFSNGCTWFFHFWGYLSLLFTDYILCYGYTWFITGWRTCQTVPKGYVSYIYHIHVVLLYIHSCNNYNKQQ